MAYTEEGHGNAGNAVNETFSVFESS